MPKPAISVAPECGCRSRTLPVLLNLSPTVAAHLTSAIHEYCERARLSYNSVPAELREIERSLADRAMWGQEGPSFDDLWRAHEAERVMPALLTYRQASVLLGVSERTVKRRVAAGTLTPVRDGGISRLRVTDLEAFIERSIGA